MTVPDYILSRAVLQEHMHRKDRDVPEQATPRTTRAAGPGRIAPRLLLSSVLRTLGVTSGPSQAKPYRGAARSAG